MKADVVVKAWPLTPDPAIGKVFAIGVTGAPLEVVQLPVRSPWNRGILLRERDVALVDGPVEDGWLTRLLQALETSDRIASVSIANAVLLRHWVLNVIGAFDASDSLAEWQDRAQRLGLVSKRLS